MVKLGSRNNSSTELENIFAQLGDYTVYHFRREEQLQEAIDYPGRGAHAEAHAKLVTRFNELRQSVLNLVSPNPDAALTDEVIALLREWLLDHVLKMDVAMRPFLSQHPSNGGR